MERKDKGYIEEILDKVRSGDKDQWQCGGMKKRSIAKKDNPGTEALLLNRQTRFLSKECSPLQL